MVEKIEKWESGKVFFLTFQGKLHFYIMILHPHELTTSAFAPFGQVIAARTAATSEANQGTAARFDALAILENHRPHAKSNVCLFRSAQRPLEKFPGVTAGERKGSSTSNSCNSSNSSNSNIRQEESGSDRCHRQQEEPLFFRVRLLERHPYSSQMFVPMNCQKRWLVVVALSKKESDGVDVCQEGNAGPDLSTMRAFMARDDQGLNFAAGVWHHPLIALESATDFACVVHEDGTKDDCHVIELLDYDHDPGQQQAENGKRSQRLVLVQVPPLNEERLIVNKL